MLGLLVALHAVFLAAETSRQVGTEPWTYEGTTAQSIGRALADTHRTAIFRIRTRASDTGALHGTRREFATGVSICADSNRLLTVFGPVSPAEAPEFLVSLRQAVHRNARVGYRYGYDESPIPRLPAGCQVPADHIWIATSLG